MVFWCNVGFALSQQQFIDQYLSGKKLDQIEGVWLRPSGGVLGFYKSGSKYNNIVISHPRGYFNSGQNLIFYPVDFELEFLSKKINHL